MKKNSVKNIIIEDRLIGQDQPTYVIAEIGSNHNGDLATAMQMIEVAADAGVDAVKFQAFKAQKHYSKFTPGFSYLNKAGISLSTYDLIKSLEINREWHAELLAYAKKCGVTFLSSPCDKEAVMQLHDIGMPAFKVASFDLPDLDLIGFIAALKKPVILSTGMADYSDIQAALRVCKNVGNEDIMLLQCTSLYPAPVHVANLAAIQTMFQAFGNIIGYSDHTLGWHIVLASVAHGAKIIEKHFTLDRNQHGPDHTFAIEPHELKIMVQQIRDIEAALGDGIKNGPSIEEAEMFQKGRRSVHVTKRLESGQVIKKEDLCIKRPGYGVSPAIFDKIVGMTVKKDIPEDHWITWEDLK